MICVEIAFLVKVAAVLAGCALLALTAPVSFNYIAYILGFKSRWPKV